MGHSVLPCGYRNMRLPITAPCPMPHAIKLYTVLSITLCIKFFVLFKPSLAVGHWLLVKTGLCQKPMTNGQQRLKKVQKT